MLTLGRGQAFGVSRELWGDVWSFLVYKLTVLPHLSSFVHFPGDLTYVQSTTADRKKADEHPRETTEPSHGHCLEIRSGSHQRKGGTGGVQREAREL